MDLNGWLSRGAMALVVLLSACQPKLGDACNLHSDCSVQGGRICEPTLPGGYCTIFNCEPDRCPEEGVCVAYQTAPSTLPECRNVLDQRLQRTFCMRACTSSSDCRTGEGYQCLDVGEGNPWGAAIVDRSPASNRICARPLSSGTASTEGEVCSPPADASFPPVPGLPEAGTPDAAVDGSSADSGARRDAAPDGPTPDASRDGSTDGPSPEGSGGEAGPEAGTAPDAGPDAGGGTRDAGVRDAATAP